MVPFAANVWTTSLSLARPICAKSYVPMPATIMERELTDRWTKTHPSIAQLSALASCGHVLFLADFITSTFGSSFQYTHGIALVFACSGAGNLDEGPAGPRCVSKFGS